MTWTGRATAATALLVLLATATAAACGSELPSPATSPTSTGSASPAGSVAATPSPAASRTPRPTARPDVALAVVADGLATPVGLVAAPDGSDRLFVFEQTGAIHVLEDGVIRRDPFLDLGLALVELTPDYDERGLLGLAFHPDFAANGRLFVYYSAPLRPGADPSQDHTNVLSELRVDDGDPNRVDPATERRILEFEQPQSNHSGGGFGFGPDGYLYLGTGDGGGRGDADEGHSAQGNAQDTSKLNGKIMRIDVDAGDPYAIPADNPFADGGGRPEIYAYGFRNPWRLAWEPDGEQRLLVSDVGYGRYEEVDAVVRGGNYGWRIREGAHCLNLDLPLQPMSGCPTIGEDGLPLIDPVFEYTHAQVGIAVVGGYRYRGSAVPELDGDYVFADFSADWAADAIPRGSLLAATPRPTGAGPWEWRRLTVEGGPLGRFVTGMGEDADGELYLLTRTTLGPTGQTGEVLRLVPAGG
jgi:glucose/arabinose dehydrogenase